MKIMQIMRSGHVFAVPRCPPASHEDSQPPDPSNTPAHIPPSLPSHNRTGDYDNNTIIYIMMTAMTITMMIVMMTTPVMMMMTNDATPAHIPPPTAPTHTTAALTRASSFSFFTTI